MDKNKTRLISFLFLFAILVISMQCKNPFDQGPGDDDLLPPPGPPALISPANKSTIYDPWPMAIQLEWSAVEGAEVYEVEVASDSTFTGAKPVSAATPGYTYTIAHDDTSYWRVRAYSTKWEWYTEWSEVWKFISYSPVTIFGVSRLRVKD